MSNATIGLVQLEYIRPVIARHIANGKYFDAALRGIPGIELCAWDAAAEPSYWFYTVLAERRDERPRVGSRTPASAIRSRTSATNRHSVFAASRCELPSSTASTAPCCTSLAAGGSETPSANASPARCARAGSELRDAKTNGGDGVSISIPLSRCTCRRAGRGAGGDARERLYRARQQSRGVRGEARCLHRQSARVLSASLTVTMIVG